MHTADLELFATVPRGLEPLLAEELRGLGAEAVQPGHAGVGFRGGIELAYRVCLWSRLASRVLLLLGAFPAPDPDRLYAGVRKIDWSAHLDPEGTLAVDFTTAASAVSHSHFAALKVKDAIVDQFRAVAGVRPSVDIAHPDVRINGYLFRDRLRLSLDLSGESLHRRGYRVSGLQAPLKENLAAALLLLAGWPERAAAGASFFDPMCGSGTLPIEAALMAADCAPGLTRGYFGFLGWRGHAAAAWESLRAEAEARRDAGLERLPSITGADADPAAVAQARENAAGAGLAGRIEFLHRPLARTEPPSGDSGLVLVNPPYGERLGAEAGLAHLYGELGRVLKTRFGGWRAGVFTGNPALVHRLRLDHESTRDLNNGAIPCRLFLYQLPEPAAAAQSVPLPPPGPLTPGAEMLANRLRKNLRHLGRWARREGVDCWRLYDADLPEYALAVDLYHGEEGRWVVLQEYAPPRTVDPERAEARLRDALAVIPQVLDLPPERLFLKRRQRQKGTSQYEKQADSGEFFAVREGPARLLVNFRDYLDTGLFLDHRITRARLRELAAGRRFLNLFAYTGAATVHAALGGAAATTTVDLSNTYLDWARRNLELNGFTGGGHEFIQADCLEWLAREAGYPPGRRRCYGLIFLDPPTFSTSKRMEGTFDVQRDHVGLIRQAAALLEPDGVLIFSSNFRRFRLDEPALAGLAATDICAATIAEDFARNPRIHRCWEIRREPVTSDQ
jgi:23S rRNA (guanine2445-N2)-methyltransferase / 23S rRNA (guanine2069-N7)-methyltransferase